MLPLKRYRSIVAAQLRPPFHSAWYSLNGTIALTDIVEAWQPKNAANYSASKVGLAHGNVLTDGAGGLAWSWQGWRMIAGVTGYLASTINPPYPGTAATILIQTDGLNTGTGLYWLIGAQNGLGGLPVTQIGCEPTASFYWLSNDETVEDGFSGLGGSNLGFAGYTAYLDGAALGAMTANNVQVNFPLFIGARNNAGTAINVSLTTIAIRAVAIYSIALSGPQVASLFAAMKAL